MFSGWRNPWTCTCSMAMPTCMQYLHVHVHVHAHARVQHLKAVNRAQAVQSASYLTQSNTQRFTACNRPTLQAP
eukprot:5383505-Prymnesium_polylepis.2